jgi:hypothetical protein
MRYSMAVPGRLPRVVPKPDMGAEPLTVDGKLIPSGVTRIQSVFPIRDRLTAP